MTRVTNGMQQATRLASFFLPLVSAILCVSCARVQIAESFRGVVVDAEKRTPLSQVAIQVFVMRVSTYDGTTQFAKDRYSTDVNGRFVLPARKKVVDSVAEHVEDVHYFEVIEFGKTGYEKREYRTDAEAGLFSWDNTDRGRLVIRLKKVDPGTTP
jgi:hypothetical protein